MDYQVIKKALDEAVNPVYIFDDDPDGVCAFLLLYGYKKAGYGVILKTKPLSTALLYHIKQYTPDALFILDVAKIDPEFIESVQIPIYWIDHHEPVTNEWKNVIYFNPKVEQFNICTTQLCYNIVQTSQWIAVAGNVSDWMLPEWIAEFSKNHPELLPENITTAPVALFDSKIGEVCRIISFVLKGSHQDAMKYVKILTRISDPRELLEPNSTQAKYLIKRYEEVKEVYQKHWSSLKKTKAKKKILVFTYSEDKISISSDLSNEALYRIKNKVILIAREKEKEYVCSIRSPKQEILPIVKDALLEVKGYGGGHLLAVGCSVPKEEFDKFISLIEAKL